MIRILPLLLLCAAWGCGEEDRTETRYTPAAERIATVADDTTPPLRRMAPAGAAPAPSTDARTAAEFPLQPRGPALPSGEVRLAGGGGRTALEVSLQGGTPGEHYAGQIRLGTCDRPGARVAWLTPVSADSAGRGAAAADLPFPADSLRRRPHVVVYGAGGRTETCGPITGAGSSPPDSASS